jgi:uncharacterized protein involved in exopolysaccharide biosynthesis
MTVEAVPFVIDLRVAAGVLRRRALVVLGGIVVGGLAAAAILLFVPPRFDGRAMMLIRTSAAIDPTSMVKDKMGALSELMPSNLGLGGTEEELATELALLQSRAVLGAVVDSLSLEVIPRTPSRVHPGAIVDSIRLTSRFKPVKVSLVAGMNRFPGATVWAKQASAIKLLDREDAIDEVADRLSVRKPGGGAVEITYRARDSLTAAQIPNLVAAVYMVRRKTVDRGLNQRRLEFLSAKADSVRGDLRHSADVLADVSTRAGAPAAPANKGRARPPQKGARPARR